jgi:hypothetical protein
MDEVIVSYHTPRYIAVKTVKRGNQAPSRLTSRLTALADGDGFFFTVMD